MQEACGRQHWVQRDDVVDLKCWLHISAVQRTCRPHRHTGTSGGATTGPQTATVCGSAATGWAHVLDVLKH